MTATRRALLLLVALVAISTGRAVGNGFAFDDIPIVVENAQVHQLAPPWVYAQQSYWPPKNLGDAYRPWTVWWLALQWAAAQGAPWIFHLVSLALTAALAFAVYCLARALVPEPAALAGAALFAVHPVHVEATANVVGQAEIWMTLFVVLATLVYVRARRAGPIGPGPRWLLVLLFLLGSASKEQGIVLPALLVALELVGVVRPEQRLGARLRALGPTLGLLTLAAVAFAAGRYLVLGDLGGGPPAAGLAGHDLAGRTLVMLPLVRDWVRLLVWPRHLLAQYSPPAYGGSDGPNGAALVGAILLASLAGLGWTARRTIPGLTLGLAWIGIGILPVSNVLFPTGILVAERTLLLPSVGIALVAAALVGTALARTRRREVGVATLLAVGLAVAAGAARSWSRQGVWRDNGSLMPQTVVDEPRSYRAWFVLGRDRLRRKDDPGAIAAYRQAGDLYPGDRRVFEDWGFALRRQNRCDLAVGVFARGVAAEPRETLARSRLFECLLTLGRYDEALRVAEAGVAAGAEEFEGSVRRAAALRDSARAVPNARAPAPGPPTPAASRG